MIGKTQNTGNRPRQVACSYIFDVDATSVQLSSKLSCIAVAYTVWAISPFQSTAQQILAALQNNYNADHSAFRRDFPWPNGSGLEVRRRARVFHLVTKHASWQQGP